MLEELMQTERRQTSPDHGDTSMWSLKSRTGGKTEEFGRDLEKTEEFVGGRSGQDSLDKIVW